MDSLLQYTPVIGAFAGATAAGVYMGGAEMMDVATSFEGGLGAAVGVALVPYVATQMKADTNKVQMLYLAAPFVLPIAVSMSVDMPILAVGAGGAAGIFLASKAVEMYYSSGSKK